MPCYSTQTETHFSSLPRAKHGFGFHELLGHDGKENPATFGIFNVDQGHPISYDKLPAHVFATVTEGEMTIEDRDKPEATVHLKAGDILHITQGTSVTWSSLTSCKGTYVYLKPLGDTLFVKDLY